MEFLLGAEHEHRPDPEAKKSGGLVRRSVSTNKTRADHSFPMEIENSTCFTGVEDEQGRPKGKDIRMPHQRNCILLRKLPFAGS
ncbi:unnamed protein product [Amoebophrya sp. A120]|nr:unnamed protein product [Amoebophrya sp. A120]|eukprot:GSA120T00005990001.1